MQSIANDAANDSQAPECDPLRAPESSHPMTAPSDLR